MENIKAILFDVDGVLTDGSISIDANGEEIKAFNVRDGQLVCFMRSNGYIFGAISGRKSKALEFRLLEMGIDFIRSGIKVKIHALNEFLKEYNLSPEMVGYIGDDVNDIEVLNSVGLSIAPADATSRVLNIVKIVTKSNGGKGVLRDVIEMLIDSDCQLKSSFHLAFKIKQSD